MIRFVPVFAVLLACGGTSQAQRLDPDHCWTCNDSREHFAAGAAIDLAAHLIPKTHAWQRVGLTCAIAAVWEAGQMDAAWRAHQSGPGYGFGLKDLAVGCAGAATSEAVLSFLTRIIR